MRSIIYIYSIEFTRPWYDQPQVRVHAGFYASYLSVKPYLIGKIQAALVPLPSRSLRIISKSMP